MATFSKVREVKNKHLDSLLERTNVVGAGIGFKIVDGEVTNELCIKVYVETKMARSRLKKKDIISKDLETVKTDVVEVGKIRFQGRRDRNRPTQGGDSLGSCHSLQYGYISFGTLGVALIDKTDGRRVLLSNNHVLANNDTDTETRANAGDPIVQPGTFDGGSCSTDLIGTLKRWIPFTLNGDNELDAAIADLDNMSDALECQIGCDIGRVNGVNVLTEDDYDIQVQKCGATTGYTTGNVLDVDATVDVGYEVLTSSGIVVRTLRFRDQIMLTAMSQKGDSGSLILDMQNKAVGLLFAGSDSVTVANRIEKVLKYLNLEFCPTADLCKIGGPPRWVCKWGGPDTPRWVCKRGGPYIIVDCVPGGPRVIACTGGGPMVPLCLACGPDSPMTCGGGGPNNLVRVQGCGSGPMLDIRITDPTIDPGRLIILDMEKIPRNMRRSFKNMLEKMAKEK